MRDPLAFPWFTSVSWVLGVFILFLAIFHFVLVKVWPLSAQGWRRVDYIWVSMALLGVLATVDQTRMLVATNLANSVEIRIPSALSSLKSAATFGTSGAICRTFIRSEFSPPEPQFTELQRDFDAQCNWFREISPRVHELTVESARDFDLSKLAASRPVGGEPFAYRSFDESLQDLRESYSALSTLRRKTSHAWFHELLLVLGPTVLAIAIALRLTKVTGELRLGRSKAEA